MNLVDAARALLALWDQGTNGDPADFDEQSAVPLFEALRTALNDDRHPAFASASLLRQLGLPVKELAQHD